MVNLHNGILFIYSIIQWFKKNEWWNLPKKHHPQWGHPEIQEEIHGNYSLYKQVLADKCMLVKLQSTHPESIGQEEWSRTNTWFSLGRRNRIFVGDGGEGGQGLGLEL